MTGKVPALSIVCMTVSALVGFGIPVLLFFWGRKKKHADVLPFFIGCAVMLLFALTLESLVHQLVFLTPPGKKMQENLWAYACYGGLMAGIFEETGRFIAFKTVLRKKTDKDVNALMYGAGHGGFEAAALLGFSMVSNIALALLINTGFSSLITRNLTGEALEQTEAAFAALTDTAPAMFLVGSIERVFAVILQIALSVFVWFAAKNSRKRFLFPAAILIHFFVDAVAVILSGYGLPILAVEAVIGVMSGLAALAAKLVWKREVSANGLPDGVQD